MNRILGSAIVPLVALLAIGLGLWLGLEHNTRFLAIPVAGGLVFYYWLWHLHDNHPNLKVLYVTLVLPGVIILALWLTAGTHESIARLIGSHFAPGFSESRFYVEEEQCVDYADRITKCGSPHLVEKVKFHSSNPQWQTALNDWIMMSLGPALALVVLGFGAYMVLHFVRTHAGQRNT